MPLLRLFTSHSEATDGLAHSLSLLRTAAARQLNVQLPGSGRASLGAILVRDARVAAAARFPRRRFARRRHPLPRLAVPWRAVVRALLRGGVRGMARVGLGSLGYRGGVPSGA